MDDFYTLFLYVLTIIGILGFIQIFFKNKSITGAMFNAEILESYDPVILETGILNKSSICVHRLDSYSEPVGLMVKVPGESLPVKLTSVNLRELIGVLQELDEDLKHTR